jgi:hypothetical protein
MMTKNFFAAAFFALTLATSFTTPSSAKQVVAPMESHGLVGREIAAPPWSAACMTDHGPSQCDEPVWIYGSPAKVARYKDAF